MSTPLFTNKGEIYDKNIKLVATAAAGIEALVGKELRNMGYDVQVEMVKPSLR